MTVVVFLLGLYLGGVATQMFRLSQGPFTMIEAFFTGLFWPLYIFFYFWDDHGSS